MKKITIITSILPILLFSIIVEAQGVEGVGRGLNSRERQGSILQNIENIRENFQNVLKVDNSRDGAAGEIADTIINEIGNISPELSFIRLREREKKENLVERLVERRQDLILRRQEMLQDAEARKVRLSTERKDRVLNLLTNMLDRFAAATHKLDSASIRLENKVYNLIESGEDVGESLSLLETANSLLKDTIIEIEAIRVESTEAIKGEISSEYISELVLNLKESIKASHEAYRAVIAEINN